MHAAVCQPAFPRPAHRPLPPPAAAAGNLDLLKVSLPVKMFEPRSYLQKLADPWVRGARMRAPAPLPLL